MKKQLHVATSPLTGTIFCGNLIEKETIYGVNKQWGENKQDVTVEVCAAVVEHIIFNKGCITVTINGIDTYEIYSIKK